MYIGLIMGKEHSQGLPGKNYMEILGRPSVEYAIMAHTNSDLLSKVFVTTDSDKIKEVANKYNVEVINRKRSLVKQDVSGLDVISHDLGLIQKEYNIDVDILCVSFANTPQIKPEIIDSGIKKMNENESIDSAVTVSRFNSFSPVRARTISKKGYLLPYNDHISRAGQYNSSRQSLDPAYFIDWAVQLYRPRSVAWKSKPDKTKPEQNNPPWQRFGQKTLALENEFSFDIDYPWQIPVVEYWLRSNGFSKYNTPYES